MSYENNDCFDWEDTIENDGQEFITLPNGDYDFTVDSFERGTFPGSEKIPSCNKAVLKLHINYEGKSVYVKEDIILHRMLEWKISAFFRSIGLKKHGEPLVMKWGEVTGKSGRCKIKIRTYIDKNGEPREINQVDSYYDYEGKPQTAKKATATKKAEKPAETESEDSDDIFG